MPPRPKHRPCPALDGADGAESVVPSGFPARTSTRWATWSRSTTPLLFHPDHRRALHCGDALFSCPRGGFTMTKRALKRHVREGAFDAGQFQGDDKIRRLPLDRAWSPLNHHNDDRDQGYLKTIKAKSPGKQELIEAIDAKNLVMALGPAGTGKTYLAIAKAVEALESGSVARIVLSRPAVEAGESIGYLPGGRGRYGRRCRSPGPR